MTNPIKHAFVTRFTSPVVLAGLFLASAVLVLIVGPLFQKGSFIDAMLYKTVAFNYAIGEGSFWSMKYTNTSMTFFCEQPPFYIYALGNFYALFGSHFLVDRVFTFLQLCVFIFFLYRICLKLFTPALPFFLLNLFLLLTIQAVSWSFSNQVIETMVLMLLAVAIDLYLGFLTNKKFMYMVWFGIIVLALFLTKGFQSCFIVILPLSYAVFHLREEKVLWFAFFTSLFLLLIIVLLVFVYEPAKNWYACYYQARLVLTMNNVGATTDKHYQILIQLVMETIGVWLVFLSLSTYLLVKKNFSVKQGIVEPMKDRFSLALFLTFLAGSVPYTLSLVQRGFYLVPAYFCLVVFLCHAFRSHWLCFFEGMTLLSKQNWVKVLVPLIFMSSVVYSVLNINSYKREKELAHDLELITPLLKTGSILGITPNVWNYFNLHSYMYMQKKISLSADPKHEGFVVVYKNEVPTSERAVIRKIELPTLELDLYYRLVKNGPDTRR